VVTTEDAHAWVEAFLPGTGWLTFDPTPLADGRGVVPPYVAAADSAPAAALPEPGAGDPAVAPPGPAADLSSATGRGGDGGAAGAAVPWLLAAAVLVALVAFAPAAIRAIERRRRLRLVRAGGVEAAATAWEEVLAESADRGVDAVASDTVRGTARRLLREHGLDDQGRTGLRTLVGAVERSWYGNGGGADTGLPAALAAVRASLARCAPMARRAKLLPRSVLRRLRRQRATRRSALLEAPPEAFLHTLRE
jgi:hypothetical protein